MIFSSIIFLFFFFPVFLLIYYLVPFKYKNLVLLFFSLLFYSWGEPIYILLLLFSSFLNYYGSIIIRKCKDCKKRKISFVVIIVINLLLLGIFKYCDFIIGNLNLFGLDIEKLNIALPLGISFFTFQTMSYTIDIYRNNSIVPDTFVNFLTYVAMFPQLVAGPIVRYDEVSKELKERKVTKDNFFNGFFKFITGLFKKVLLANNIGYIFSLITRDLSNISLLTAWLGIISFALQIYYDFSGYSDMAKGIGEMLGFKYPDNFNYPYIASSITDFWRRWHITLSSWFRDYVYIPLGGNRCSKIVNIRNILVVWLLTGIWHGASWNYILWGLYFGILLLIEKYILKNVLVKMNSFVKHIYSIILILIGWVIFSFEDFNALLTYLKSMFINQNIIDNNFIFFIQNYYVFYLFGIIFCMPIIGKVKINIFIKILIVIIYIFLFIVTISSLVGDTYNPFLYFRF